ncbi:MAG: hypothetical protein AAF514_01340, partial [Verrucomicrobiota bacterium]
TDVAYLLEVSKDMVAWRRDTAVTIELNATQDLGNGVELVTVESKVPVQSTWRRQYLRIRPIRIR